MGLLNENILPSDYYSDNDSWGKYQFTSLDDIITQFQIAYVGEDKVISKIKRADIAFHAQRVMQELSFDTFKSHKAYEIEIPASLTMILPQDYINYIKLTWSDSAGIEHILYPAMKTSNPIAIVQTDSGEVQADLVANGTFDNDISNWISATNSNTTLQQTLGNANAAAYVFGDSNILANAGLYKKIYQTIAIEAGKTYKLTYTIGNPPGGGMTGKITACLASTTTSGDNTYYKSGGYNDATGTYTKFITVNGLATSTSSNSWAYSSALLGRNLFFQNGSATENLNCTIDNVTLFDTELTTQIESDTWSNYKSGTSSANQDDYRDNTYWPMDGSRFGLNPQYAQANGSFYIDSSNGKIHFSSNISGKTVILKYLSDGLGTDEEMQVHKFAEEAMYKSILCAIMSAKANVGRNQLTYYKKEKFAAVRTAKLRLSNIKLEELTQVLRGKSKHIKH